MTIPAGEEPDGQVGDLRLVGVRDGHLEDQRPNPVRVARRELDAGRPAARDGIGGDRVDRERIQHRGHGVGLLLERAPGVERRPQVAGPRRRDGPEARRLERLAQDARVVPLRCPVEDHDVGGLATTRDFDGPARRPDHFRDCVQLVDDPGATRRAAECHGRFRS